MKGFEINYNNKEKINVTTDDGMITIHIFANNDGNRLYVGGVDYSEYKTSVWKDNSTISIGDRWDIKFAEIDIPSTPAKTSIDKNIKRPPTKLDTFRILEEALKKEGLL
jgi:hypothetical protein